LARAEVYESQKHYDLAISEYRRVLKMDPRLPGIHFRLGRTFLLRSKDDAARDEAIHAFRKELDIDPHSSAAWYEIGEIYRQRGQLQEAVEPFSQAVKYHPKFEDAHIALGRTLLTLKRPQEALDYLLAAVNLNPTNGVTHYLLASAYRALGDNVNYGKEMALYQQYHARPYSDSTHGTSQDLADFTPPKVTKQMLNPDVLSQH
jgi:tetratricopeptide (TPR) repeat protein